ncbi:MAG: DUF4276 family protein [Candidatus Latescibacterota bacterium]
MSKVIVIAEGGTERAIRQHLKSFLDQRAGGLPKVRLNIVALDGGLNEKSVRELAEGLLHDPEVVGVVALTDLYPKFSDTATAVCAVSGWMPQDPRCHVAVAKHDFEAWLLAGWKAVLRQARIPNKQPWAAQPEDINHEHPPAHRLRALFQSGERPRKYEKSVDGRKLFEGLDLVGVAALCPELKRFLNCLLECAGYPVLP